MNKITDNLKSIAFRAFCLKYVFYFVNISYLVDQCIHPVRSRSCQMLEKNVLSWALTGTGGVASIRQVSSQHPASPCACARMRTSSFCLAPLCLLQFYTREMFSNIVCYTLHKVLSFVDIIQVKISWHHRAKGEEIVDIKWRVMIFMKDVIIAGTKSLDQTLVLKIIHVQFVTR